LNEFDFPVSHAQTSAFPLRLPEGGGEMFLVPTKKLSAFPHFQSCLFALRLATHPGDLT
jgi:hypothetical protein